jgi:hypothetical protein
MIKYFFISYVVTGNEFTFGNSIVQVNDSLFFNQITYMDSFKPKKIIILFYNELTEKQFQLINASPT